MRKTYVVQRLGKLTRADDDGWGMEPASHTLATTVYEVPPFSEPTGLLDPDGNPILCHYASDPIGFLTFREDSE